MCFFDKRRTCVAAALAALLLLLSTAWLYAGDKKKKNRKPDTAAAQMDERRRAVHALNRLTFGPRPGDIDRVVAIGVDKWIDEQLTPRKIEDGQLEARLLPFRTLRMDPREMLENFPPPQVVKAVADGKMSMPRDPEKRAVYEAALARYQRRKLREDNNAAANVALAEDSVQTMADTAEREEMRAARARAREDAGRLRAMPPDNRMDAILKMSADDRTALIRELNSQERLMLVQGLDPKQKETLVALMSPQAVIVGELQQAKILRAAYSERQLEEVMTDFWFNHFNVFINKGPDRYLVTAYERDVIRPRALGKFKDLLMATAKSPAMLFYLDNWQSVGPDSAVAGNRPNPQNPVFRPWARNRVIFAGRWPVPIPKPSPQRVDRTPKRPARGLNENYAREIMELHTLGVNGGYTQQDVTELAKVLTGWTVRQPRRGGGYEFNPRMHEPGKKTVLGRHFNDEGEKEGEKAIEMLARHPATAQFISRKLAMRFVSDNPPEPLVKRMAETFRKTDGDIREVLRTLFSSPEFWAPETYRAKVKTPLEFVVSAVRATGADAQSANALVQNLNRMGMPLYAAQPPTGYSMKAETWVNSAALLDRMNFALALGGGRLRDVSVDPAQAFFPGEAVPADSAAALARLEGSLLGGDVSPQTDETIRKRLDDPQVAGRAMNGAPRPVNLGVLTGLILGSPEFQHR
jgi:uncharacterized protein (DUF1800 family)